MVFYPWLWNHFFTTCGVLSCFSLIIHFRIDLWDVVFNKEDYRRVHKSWIKCILSCKGKWQKLAVWCSKGQRSWQHLVSPKILCKHRSCISPVARTKCWCFIFLKTIDGFTFTTVIHYVPYWHFSNTCHITITLHIYLRPNLSVGEGDGGGGVPWQQGCQDSDCSLRLCFNICTCVTIGSLKETTGQFPDMIVVGKKKKTSPQTKTLTPEILLVILCRPKQVSVLSQHDDIWTYKTYNFILMNPPLRKTIMIMCM